MAVVFNWVPTELKGSMSARQVLPGSLVGYLTLTSFALKDCYS